MCREGSSIHEFLSSFQIKNVYAVSVCNTVDRIFWELFRSKSFLDTIKPDVIYSVFGYSLFSSTYKQVIGVALSNLFYPEIDFWANTSAKTRIVKFFADIYRKKTIRLANGLIFENPEMYKRAVENYGFNKSSVTYIKPSIKPQTSRIIDNEFENNEIKILLLCGWQKNKNYMIVPSVCKILKEKGFRPRVFFSVKDDSKDKDYLDFINLLKKTETEDCFNFIGTVKPEEIKNVYEKVNFVFLLSQLESFSNNIIESWTFKRVLVVSDMDWSRSIVRKGGCYVNRNSPTDIANHLIFLQNNQEEYNKIIEYGIEELSTYPTLTEQVSNILSFLKRYETGS